jgi:hypothetical protein
MPKRKERRSTFFIVQGLIGRVKVEGKRSVFKRRCKGGRNGSEGGM